MKSSTLSSFEINRNVLLCVNVNVSVYISNKKIESLGMCKCEGELLLYAKNSWYNISTAKTTLRRSLCRCGRKPACNTEGRGFDSLFETNDSNNAQIFMFLYE